MNILVGDIIPLSAQLHDGKPDVEVRAIVRDDIGLELTNEKLFHAGSGLYISNDVNVPDVRHVVVQYITNAPKDYEIGTEVFKALPKPKPQEKIAIGEVLSKIKSIEIITGIAKREKQTTSPNSK